LYSTKKIIMQTNTKIYVPGNGQVIDLSCPQVMGILNVTPDSFYSQSRTQTENEIAERAHQIIQEGGSIIDVGAYSSRPNAEHISSEEEMKRLRTALEVINREIPQAIISVDTFRADAARMCVEEYGVSIINDISSGDMDKEMFPTVARLGIPYIMMHMQGTPQNMQARPRYTRIVEEVLQYLNEKIQCLRALEVKSLIVDPGFGFGKTLSHNYELLSHLEEFGIFNLPVLVGVSRKSMIYRLLGGGPEDALNGTTVMNTIALTKGADILRVHDVKAASEAVRIFSAMSSPNTLSDIDNPV